LVTKKNTEEKNDPTATLRRAIETGHFMPSERLVETELAAWLGTNRANVRVALGKLVQEGLVVSEPNRGARVRVISEREALEILQVRMALESLVARQASKNVKAADKKKLREILESMQAAIADENFTTYSARNGVLHQEIRRISNHVTASRLLSTLNSQIVRYQFRTVMFPGRINQSIAEHSEIVEAICAGDGDRAARAMSEHLGHVAETLEKGLAALAAPLV
jgi:DNA-binding GntR family transcriptional regulator